MGLSTFAMNELLDALLGAGTYNSTGVFVSLHTADPGTTGATEAADANYARIEATGGAAFSAASGGVSDNDGAITFASGTGWVADETITHVGLWDAVTAGNFLIGGALDAPVAVTAGAEVEFAAAALEVSLS